MILDEKQLIEKCAGDETHSAAVQHVYLTADGRLEATDSFVAASIPVTLMAGDVPGAIPLLLFRLVRDKKVFGNGIPQIELKAKTATVPGVLGMNRPVVSTKPPTFSELKKKFGIEKREHRVSLDVMKLAQAAAALGTTKIVLEFSGDPHEPVLVYSQDGEQEGEAFVMPMQSTMAPAKARTDAEQAAIDEQNGEGDS